VRIVSIGEILWDVFPDSEHLGGAPFNFAWNANQLGHDVRFVSAVGTDVRGRRALDQMQRLGLSNEFVQSTPEAPTGEVTVEFTFAGEPAYTIHRPAAYDLLEFDRAIIDFDPDWIYFGTLFQSNAHSRAIVGELLNSLPRARRFYDVNLRPNSYTLELVHKLMREADVVKLNQDEFRTIAPAMSSAEKFCRTFAHDYDLQAICVTRGENGCAAFIGNEYVEAPGHAVTVADPVGAGDAFAAAFLHGLDLSWPAPQIADFANRAGAQAASHPGAIP
jgi:fructokinase